MSSNQDGIAEGHLSECEQENRMLRAEREVWANIAQERNDLRAEVERLRAEVVRLDDLADDRLMEVERLRAAARRVMKAYAGNDTSEQMKALGALSDALAHHME